MVSAETPGGRAEGEGGPSKATTSSSPRDIRRLRTAVAPLGLQSHQAPEAFLEGVEVVLDHQASSVEHPHPVGDGLDASQIVAGDQHCRVAVRKLSHQLSEQIPPRDRIEAEGRVVEHQGVG